MRILWIVIRVISVLILAVLAFVFIPRLLQPEPVELDGKYRSAANGQGTRSFWIDPLTSVLDVIDIDQKTIRLYFDGNRIGIASPEEWQHIEGKNRLTPLAGLAFAFVLAGIFFGENRLIRYGLIGIGIILAVVDIIIRSRKKSAR